MKELDIEEIFNKFFVEFVGPERAVALYLLLKFASNCFGAAAGFFPWKMLVLIIRRL